MYRQQPNLFEQSPLFATFMAAVPLIVVFGLIIGFRVRGHWAALGGVLAATATAMAVFHMPWSQTVSAGAEGAVYGLVPVTWIVLNALWLHRMTLYSGAFDRIQSSLRSLSDDTGVQAILIAFSLGSLLEALAGFGTPVAIAASLLVGLGVPGVRAVCAALIGNTAPAAFGAMGSPVLTLARVTGEPTHDLAGLIGRQTPLLSLVVPFVIVWFVGGAAGIRRTWPVALIAGVTYGLGQFLSANFLTVELTDIVAASVSLLAVWLLFLRRGAARPAGQRMPAASSPGVRVGTGGSDTSALLHAAGPPLDEGKRQVKEEETGKEPPHARPRDLLPYLLVIAVFLLFQLPPFPGVVEWATFTFHWPGLHVIDAGGKPSPLAEFSLQLGSGGTLILAAGIVSAAILRITPTRALRIYGETLRQLRYAVVTVSSVLALAYVMNLSGQATVLGRALALSSGTAVAFLAPAIGWLGVAITGSDTSANALFGGLDVAAAHRTGLSVNLLAAANDSGGTLGKAVSPQNLAIAVATTGLEGSEAEILKKVVGWSLLLLLACCLVVYLQSTAILSWMTG